jgi:hypothetical protein
MLDKLQLHDVTINSNVFGGKDFKQNINGKIVEATGKMR